MGTFQSLTRQVKDLQLDVVYWDARRNTPFRIEETESASFHARSSFTTETLYDFLVQKQPDILYVSGWMDRGYTMASIRYKRKFPDVKVVAGIDDQWKGTVRQHLGSLLFRFKLKRFIDYFWVTGMPQYHYARRMGYGPEEIIPYLYSANTHLFQSGSGLAKRIVFLGRYHPVKGISLLLKAYARIEANLRREWPLILIGDGPLRQEIEQAAVEGVELRPFMQPPELVPELAKGGVFCLPSTKEAWGVVIHEMAILGYPMVLSSACGAASEFLVPNYNGYRFRSGDEDDLHRSLRKMISLDDAQRHLFGERSRQLGSRITSDLTAHSLLSILSDEAAPLTLAALEGKP